MFSIFIAIGIVKTDENNYDLLVFRCFLATVALKNVVYDVRCYSNDLLTIAILSVLTWR